MLGTLSNEKPAIAARPSSSSPSFWLVFLALLGLGLLFGSAAAALARKDSGLAPRTGPAGAPLAIVELGDLFIMPATVDVPAGRDAVIEVRNGGQIPHNLTLAGGRGSRLLGPGEAQSVSFGSLAASATLFCSVPGHRSAGMEMKLTLLGDVPSTGGGH